MDKAGTKVIDLLETIGAKEVRKVAALYNAPYILVVNIGIGGVMEEAGTSGECLSMNVDLKDVGHGMTTGTYVQHLVGSMSLNNTMTSFYRPQTADCTLSQKENAINPKYDSHMKTDEI